MINLVRNLFTFINSIDFFIDNITIKNSYGRIVADNVWGALNGLETFSQLLYITEDNYVRILLIREKMR